MEIILEIDTAVRERNYKHDKVLEKIADAQWASQKINENFQLTSPEQIGLLVGIFRRRSQPRAHFEDSDERLLESRW